MKQKTCPIRSWRNLKFSALHGVVFAALFIQGFEHFAARAEKKYVLVEIDTDDLTQIGGKKYAAPDSKLLRSLSNTRSNDSSNGTGNEPTGQSELDGIEKPSVTTTFDEVNDDDGDIDEGNLEILEGCLAMCERAAPTESLKRKCLRSCGQFVMSGKNKNKMLPAGRTQL